MPDKILLIEDDQELGSQIVESLKKAGFDPTWWRAGRHIEPLHLQGLVLVILDLMLPTTYGLDILKQLRARQSHAQLVVVVLTSDAEETTSAEVLQAGANAHCTKPIAPSTLLKKLQELGVPATLVSGCPGGDRP